MELLLLPEGLEGALLELASSRGCAILDYSGKLARMDPQVTAAIDAWDLESALSRLIDALGSAPARCVYAYSLSALWALSHVQLGLRGSVIGLVSFAVRANLASEALGARLVVVAEDWFQRRHRYVYNVFSYASDRVSTLRGARHSILGAR
ncbi:MAG: hypothetical protein ACP5LG_03595 [Conexivisphaera sp.]